MSQICIMVPVRTLRDRRTARPAEARGRRPRDSRKRAPGTRLWPERGAVGSRRLLRLLSPARGRRGSSRLWRRVSVGRALTWETGTRRLFPPPGNRRCRPHAPPSATAAPRGLRPGVARDPTSSAAQGPGKEGGSPPSPGLPP